MRATYQRIDTRTVKEMTAGLPSVPETVARCLEAAFREAPHNPQDPRSSDRHSRSRQTDLPVGGGQRILVQLRQSL